MSPIPTKDNPARLIYHGVMYESRGLSNLIIAVVHANREPGVYLTLTLLGDGPDLENLKRKRDELGAHDVVLFLPPVPYREVPNVIAKHHIGVVPLPDFECWRTSAPTKVQEYVAMGKPLVLTDIEAHRRTFGDQPFVVWANSDRVEDLTGALVQANAQMQALAACAVAGPRLAREVYSWDVQVAKLAQSLENLAADAASRATEDSVE
jgi:glycosyltransferase involved in cell wall biosynthesis